MADDLLIGIGGYQREGKGAGTAEFLHDRHLRTI